MMAPLSWLERIQQGRVFDSEHQLIDHNQDNYGSHGKNFENAPVIGLAVGPQGSPTYGV